jgi:hypothetical protein
MKDEIERLERLAREAMRAAIGAANGSAGYAEPSIADEALDEFRKAVDPALFLDLVREHRSQQEKLKEWSSTHIVKTK